MKTPKAFAIIGGGIVAFLLATQLSCKNPISITANPDDQTSTSGTAGSAKMTEQLPPKRDNVKLPDSLKPTKKDTLPF